MVAEERTRLEQIAGLTAQQAREELVRVMEDEARIEAANIVKRIEYRDGVPVAGAVCARL